MKNYNFESPITALDFSQSGAIWAAGTMSGALFLRDPGSSWGKKEILNFGNGEKINVIRFYNKNEALVATSRELKYFWASSYKLKISFSEKNIMESDGTVIEISPILLPTGQVYFAITKLDCV